MAMKKAPVEGVYERAVGSGIWYARYYINNKQVRKSFGRDRVAAVAWVEAARTVKRSGVGILPTSAKKAVKTAGDLAAERVAAAVTPDSVLIGELCDGLLAHIQSNPARYKDQLNPPYRLGVIKEAFGDRPAASIETYEIEDWFGKLPGKPATQNRYRAQMSSVFTFGMRRKQYGLKFNPARNTDPVPVDNGVIRFLLPSEETSIRTVLQEDVDACGPRNDQLKKHMIHRICEFDVALDSGMRESEQYDLLRPDITYEIKELTARDTKNGTSRQVHLTKRAMKALKTLEDLNLVRKCRSKDIPNDSPADVAFAIRDNKNWWGDVLRRAGVTRFRWHDLRHTFCSRLAQRGASAFVIMALAGHKTYSMAARYSHLNKTSVVRGLALLELDDKALALLEQAT
ncbi:MAG: site-specific integrase [Acidobacteriota bacterium]|nr:site-specific integrase [Acidobacteriota bacterium]